MLLSICRPTFFGQKWAIMARGPIFEAKTEAVDPGEATGEVEAAVLTIEDTVEITITNCGPTSRRTISRIQ